MVACLLITAFQEGGECFMRVFIGDIKREMGRSTHEVMEETRAPMIFGGEKILFARPVRVDATVTNCGSEILVEGIVETTLVLNCSCCLEPSIHELQIPFHLESRNLDRISRPSDFEAEARDADEVQYYHEEDAYINIDAGIRESLLANFPMKPLCRESCLGLCLKCGKNLNQGPCGCQTEDIDPRLAVLKNVILP
ncbi:MAG: DUF177 domain-containing protein [Atribacterota bacterium]